MHSYRVAQNARNRLGRPLVVGLAHRKLPVALERFLGGRGRDFEVVGGGKRAHATKRGLGCGNRSEREKVGEGGLRGLHLHEAARGKGGDLGREHEMGPGARVIQRLDAEPVAGEKEAALAGVPEGEGEHAAEPMEEPLDAPRFVAVDEDLGVRRRAKPVAEREKLAAELAKVIDLTVVGEKDIVVLVGHRTGRRRREVDDREAPVSQEDGAAVVLSLSVGAAMALAREHAVERGFFRASEETRRSIHSGDTTHGC